MYNTDQVWEKSLCSICLSKQKQSHTKVTDHEMSHPSTQQQALHAFMGGCDSLHPTRSGKALCLPHPGDHSNLIAESNESHSWGWDAFVCFSSGESPAGFFIQVLEKKNTGGSWLPRSKTITENSIQGSLSKTQHATR